MKIWERRIASSENGVTVGKPKQISTKQINNTSNLHS